MATDKKLFLFDAMALIYRAHFAFSKNPRINSKGMNTGAALGFTNTLTEVLQKEKPTHLGVAFDTPAPTFRHTTFEAYKANRQEQPEDIQFAIPYVKEIVRAFNLPVIECDGYEADDVIGTLALKAAAQGFTVFMMTPDKDYGQLVSERIFLYKPAFMGNGVEVMGVPEVLQKWEISRVDQVVDMLGLQGDQVDNIPGIPGIGPKTAARLLAEYDTVENLLAHAESLKGKTRETLLQFGQQGLLSKQLATIHTDAPVSWDEEAFAWTGFNKERLEKVFQELEFRTLAQKLLGTAPAPAARPAKNTPPTAQASLFGAAPAPQPANQQEPDATDTDPEAATEIISAPVALHTIENTLHQYHLVETEEEISQLLRFMALQKHVCFDTETTSLNPLEAELVGISFAWQAHQAYYVPFPAEQAEAQARLKLFRPFFENGQIGKTGQNMKYDIAVLQRYGIQVRGELFDTMLAHYLIEPETRHNMDYLSATLLGYQPVSIETLIGKKGKGQGNMREVALPLIKEYAAEDADITWQLRQVLEPKMEADQLGKLFREIEMPLMSVLAEMEANGVKIDEDALNAFSAELGTEIGLAEQKIYRAAGHEFNISSPKQLGEILFDKLKLIDKPKKTKTGQYATGEEILIQLAPDHEIVREILEYRQLQKLKSTYVDALPQLVSPTDGLIHTSYNQAVAATGRLSSTNPNLQNIPIRTERGREIRKAFVPRSPEFLILSADYSQIELRIMAAFSKDEYMIEAFRSGRDIHTTTAAKIFKVPIEQVDTDMRRKAKTANFGIIYGISAFGLSQRLNIPRKEAGEIIDAYFAEFPAVRQYMDQVVAFAREREYVETIMGRRRYLRDINSRNQTLRGFAERNAINAPIQGSAADLIKKAMVDISHWMKAEKLRSRLIMQVHDELVFDAHRSETEYLAANVQRLMENALSLEIPLVVEVGMGENWLEAH